jgi:hypothetical protein
MKVRGILTGVAMVLVSCSRYEWRNELDVPDLCDASRVASPASATGVFRQANVRTAPGVLAGRVADRLSGQSLAYARIRATDSSATVAASTDSTGAFEFSSLRPARYSVTVDRIGYQRVTGTLVLAAGAGNTLDVLLAPSVHDGPCSGFAAVRVRKPWWKVW